MQTPDFPPREADMSISSAMCPKNSYQIPLSIPIGAMCPQVPLHSFILTMLPQISSRPSQPVTQQPASSKPAAISQPAELPGASQSAARQPVSQPSQPSQPSSQSSQSAGSPASQPSPAQSASQPSQPVSQQPVSQEPAGQPHLARMGLAVVVGWETPYLHLEKYDQG